MSKRGLTTSMLDDAIKEASKGYTIGIVAYSAEYARELCERTEKMLSNKGSMVYRRFAETRITIYNMNMEGHIVFTSPRRELHGMDQIMVDHYTWESLLAQGTAKSFAIYQELNDLSV